MLVSTIALKMAHQRHRNYPSTEAEFVETFPDNERNTIHSMPASVAKASGSRWNMAHLEACRVIVSLPAKPHTHLEVLSRYCERARIHIEALPRALSSLEWVSPKMLKECPSAGLREIGGQFGAFYSLLAEVARMPDLVRRARSGRDIQRPSNPDFVTGEGLGFSSPLGTDGSGQNQSSSFSPSESDPLERSDHELRRKHEVVTANMTAEFISSLLDTCSHPPDSDSRLEFNPAPSTYALDTPALKSTCQDDGCIVRRCRSQLTGYWITQGFNLAIVECKAQYTIWNEDEDIASVSSNVRAQQVCEMLSSGFQRIEAVHEIGDLSPKSRQ